MRLYDGPMALAPCGLLQCRRPLAPRLVSAIEAGYVLEPEVAQDLRILLAGIALVAIDQDRRALPGAADDVAEIAGGDVLRLVDMAFLVGLGVADIEDDHVRLLQDLLGVGNADALEGAAFSHGSRSSGLGRGLSAGIGRQGGNPLVGQR